MKLFLTTFILFATVSMYSQTYLGELQSLTNTEVMRDRTKINEMDLSKIKGSPFAEKEFMHGTVYVNDSVFARNVPLRYNIFEDIIEVQYDTYDIRPIQRTNKVEAKIRNDHYIFIDSKNKYFTKLTENKQGAVLLRKTDIEYQPEVSAVGTYVRGKPAEFVHHQTYFIYEGGHLTEIPKRRRNFFQAFGPKGKEIENYFRSNKLSINKEDDLITIINYYNSI